MGEDEEGGREIIYIILNNNLDMELILLHIPAGSFSLKKGMKTGLVVRPINQRVKSQFCIADNLYSGRNIIKIKDFAVRRSTFMCVNKQHIIQDIEAVFKIIDKNANIHEETVSAGFCPYCNIYFIMESRYRELRKKGIIACRISDEKTYLSNSQKTMKLAHQSILMQYGYNVSQTSELSETVRRKILSILIDNGIMSKTDIISYLDFFISQHKSERYYLAVEKWKSDRAFVNEYKKGCFEKYTVGNLHK